MASPSTTTRRLGLRQARKVASHLCRLDRYSCGYLSSASQRRNNGQQRTSEAVAGSEMFDEV